MILIGPASPWRWGPRRTPATPSTCASSIGWSLATWVGRMTKRLLDLFCGVGGAAVGYHRAGFEVVGVDHRKMPRYPFEFHKADALDFLMEHAHEFDVIHASPPCQGYTRLNYEAKASHPKMVPA